MKKRAFASLGLFARGVGIVLMLCGGLAFMTPGGVSATPGSNIGNGPGCVAGGKGYVGELSGDETGGEPVFLNWHGTFVFSLCGGTGPQSGDSDVQHLTYPDGTTESYKIVYSTQDLGTLQGAFCYMNVTTGGYHCNPDGYVADGSLYEWIISSSGDSPYLEPAGSGGWQSNPNGRGIYS